MSRLIASAAAVCVVTLALALAQAQSPNEICCSSVYNLVKGAICGANDERR